MSRNLNSALISVSPKKMTFYAPYNRIQKRQITIMNPTASRLLYKIRSNAQWIYNAVPNCGCIEPYDISEIDISLNYFQFHAGKNYCHRFSVQCILAPPQQQVQHQPILFIFKKMRRSDIHSVRVPIELAPEAMCIDQEELDVLLPHDFQKLLWNSRPFGIDFLNDLQQVTLPRDQKKCCGWGRALVTMFIIVSGLTGAYLHRQQIEDSIQMHFKMDNMLL